MHSIVKKQQDMIWILFIRPPMGEYNERTLALTKKMGYRTIFWSMAYVDFKVDQQPGKDYVIEHFQKYTHKGAIPLIHNISRSNAEALETVIINLKKMDTDLKDWKNCRTIERNSLV